MGEKEKTDRMQSEPPLVCVHVERGESNARDFNFRRSFRVGRDENCDLQLSDSMVSRFHAEINFEGGSWWVRDLNSTNGTYVEGVRIDQVPLARTTRLHLGLDGPILQITVEGSSTRDMTAVQQSPSITRYIQHYFSNLGAESIGEHTRFIRRAFEHVQKQQRWKFARIVAALVILVLISGGYAFLKHRQLEKNKKLAADIFYGMKTLELDIARLEKEIARTQDTRLQEEIEKARVRHREMEDSYKQFVHDLGIYKGMGEEKRLIFRIARIFGECEINMPEGFVREVRHYIRRWQSTDRLRRAIARAQRRGYARLIVETMLEHHLPPQFFYLALQESDFKHYAVGPRTRYGIAKGIWQFIPMTAVKYGLRTGPLVELRRYDPRDERYAFEKATAAAAKYIRDIYSTEAQASGLLVMASYNWGQTNVRNLIRRLPENPRERNLWRLLAAYKARIPQQTYDYVFYIVSAAVIGENPRLFGFDFDNPLAEMIQSDPDAASKPETTTLP
jgi:hypothetical protein